VIGQRDEDQAPLEDADQRKGVEEEDLLGVGDGAVDDLEVGDDVLDQKAPMGTIPVREWSLRQKKEWPSPARSGCTPRREGVAGGLAVRLWPCGTP